MLRKIKASLITKTVKELCILANRSLPEALKSAIEYSAKAETEELPKSIMCELCRNLKVAKEKGLPICQDTGMAVVFLEIGQDVHIVGGDLTDAVNKGVAEGYNEGLLRKSIVADPLNRVNTEDNTPAIIHTKIVRGNKIKITVAPKGFGSENMSAIKMLTPYDAKKGVVDFVLETVKRAGSNPCPPIVVELVLAEILNIVRYFQNRRFAEMFHIEMKTNIMLSLKMNC